MVAGTWKIIHCVCFFSLAEKFRRHKIANNAFSLFLISINGRNAANHRYLHATISISLLQIALTMCELAVLYGRGAALRPRFNVVNRTIFHISDRLSANPADCPTIIDELPLNELNLLVFNVLQAVLVALRHPILAYSMLLLPPAIPRHDAHLFFLNNSAISFICVSAGSSLSTTLFQYTQVLLVMSCVQHPSIHWRVFLFCAVRPLFCAVARFFFEDDTSTISPPFC